MQEEFEIGDQEIPEWSGLYPCSYSHYRTENLYYSPEIDHDLEKNSMAEKEPLVWTLYWQP